MRLLIVAESSPLTQKVKVALTRYYDITCTNRYEDALLLSGNSYYSGIIIDSNTFKGNSLALLSEIRSKGIITPLLMVVNNSSDMIAALDNGADSCLTYPYNITELMARIRSMLRRYNLERSSIVFYSDIEYDQTNGILSSYKGTTLINKIEGQLMELFILNPGKAYSLDELCIHVWGCSSLAKKTILNTQIYFIQRKLAIVSSCAKIQSHFGKGSALNTFPADEALYF